MDKIEKRILDLIDEKKEELIAFSRESYHTAEACFCEFNTAKRVADYMKSIGLTPREGIAITGVKAKIGKEDGPCLAIIGELDGVMCRNHPQADKETGISHSCCHHGQINAMLGAAVALNDSEVLESLGGAVAFMAVPAEEFLPVEKRKELRGTVRRCCGKSEFLSTGEFDDVDIALTTHVHMVERDSDIMLGNNASTGTLSKIVKIKGVASHAAAAPHLGVNALSAATLGLSALGLIRETFRECDTVRVHSNITKGGDAVNVVPDNVVVDGMIRASNIGALNMVSRKFDEAFIHTAKAVGATAEVETWQGYLPVIAKDVVEAQKQAEKTLKEQYPNLDINYVEMNKMNAASTDVGDLSHVMPVINFTHGGVTGSLHSADFTIVDEEKAMIIPAKVMALTTYHMLKNNAKLAKEELESFTPALTMKEYKEYIEPLQ